MENRAVGVLGRGIETGGGVDRQLRQLPAPVNFTLGLVLLASVWAVDRWVGPQVSMAILYLLPIGFVAWFCGGTWAYGASILSAAAWLQADIAAGHHYSHWFIPYWNAAVRFGFFIVVTVLSGIISRLRELSEKEHEVSELKSDLISLSSHEFGNFLTTFRLSLTVLRESEGALPSPQRTQCYAVLDRVCSHLNNSVANFLNLNRIESGQLMPRIKRTSMQMLIHGVVSQMGLLIENKHLTFGLDLPSNPVLVRADPDALSIVLSNLIGNAIKYTPAGGSVTVRVIEQDGASPKACVSVEDTGIGISKPEQRLIASGYYRTEAGRKIGKGFGVGLKVTRELLRSQDASLKIESESGHGSRFSFLLPLWEDEPKGAVPRAGKAMEV